MLYQFRSCDLDEWTAEQLQIMKLSGNGTTRDFFKKHGVTETQMTVDTKFIYISYIFIDSLS